MVTALILSISLSSCDFEYDIAEAGSKEDTTPPSANFSASQGAGPDEEWKDYTFGNSSVSATTYAWDFGDTTTTSDVSSSVDGAYTYPGEGMYTVTLTASDALGIQSVYTDIIDVVEPEDPPTADPVLVNTIFEKIGKLGGSDCSCSGWDNDDIGQQGESSSTTISGVSTPVLKFDNNEPDHIYQEFAVEANADYSIEITTQFKNIASPPGSFPGADLELRVLAGTGYGSGYTPTYYATAPEYPSSGYGYTTIAQVETAANNLYTTVREHPMDDDYILTTYVFNSGANTSVALFMRGIGGDGTASTADGYGYASGDEEIRVQYVTITAVN